MCTAGALTHMGEWAGAGGEGQEVTQQKKSKGLNGERVSIFSVLHISFKALHGRLH